MIEGFHFIIALQILPGMLLGMAVCLFFISIPDKPALKNYRLARKMLGCAYLLYAFVLIVKYLLVPSFPVQPSYLARSIIIIVSSFQAFMFTYALITLLDTKFMTRKRIAVESIPILLFTAATIIVNKTGSEASSKAFFFIFVAFYLLLLVRYVLMFIKYRRIFRSKMDDYFSASSDFLSRKVTFWFYASFSIGLCGLAFALTVSTWATLIFLSIFSLFYIIFGVHFLNYPDSYQSVEDALELKESASDDSTPSERDQEMMERIEELMRSQQPYKKSDLSIIDVATSLDASPKMISAAINRCRRENFKTYISRLRVIEAQNLLSAKDSFNLKIEAIGYSAGFASKTNFYRVFKQITGSSPKDFPRG